MTEHTNTPRGGASPRAGVPRCQAFSRQDKVTRHVKSVHEQRKDRVCALCSKAFSRQDKLTAHMKSVHSTQISHPACRTCITLYDELTRYMEPPYNMSQDDASMKVAPPLQC